MVGKINKRGASGSMGVAGAGMAAPAEKAREPKKTSLPEKKTVAKSGAAAKAERKPASLDTVRGVRARVISGEQTAKERVLSAAQVQNALTTSGDGPDGGGSVSERQRVDQEAKVEQDRRLKEGKWPEATAPTETKADPNDPDARVPPAPTETTSERAGRIGGEVLDPSTLKPGESVKVKLDGDGSVGVGVGLKVAASDEMEIKANKDGTFTITADGKTAGGVIGNLGVKVKGAGLGGGVEVMGSGSQKIEIKARNAEEAKKIAYALAKQAAYERAKETLPGGRLLPSPLTSSEQKLIKSRVTATESTWSAEAGFDGTAGVADSSSPVNVGAKGANTGREDLTTRTEFELDDNGEPYPARIKDIRKQEADLKGTVGISGDTGDVSVSAPKVAQGSRTTTHELIFTRHLPKPGSDEQERNTTTMRETNVDESQTGRSKRSTKIVKEQEVDMSNLSQREMGDIWKNTRTEERHEQMRQLPATKTRVTIEESETASTQGLGPYNSNRRTQSETFEIAKDKQGEVFTQRDTDPARLREMKDPGSEVVRSESEVDIEGVGTGGKIGISVMGTGVGIDADLQKTTER